MERKITQESRGIPFGGPATRCRARYYKRASYLIDEGQFGAATLLTPFNYRHGTVEGADLSLSYDADNWSLHGNFATSKALGKGIESAQFNFAPDELSYIAGHYIHLDHDQTCTGSAGIAYTFPATRTRVLADLLSGSGLRAGADHPNGGSLPKYHQVNVSIVQKIDTGWRMGTELRLDVINRFDEVCEIRDGSIGAPQFCPRRTILAGMTRRL